MLNGPQASTPPGVNSQPGLLAAPGLVIPDHELVRCIGRGSYGEVWLARNSLGTYRAVKLLRRQSFKLQRPFERELSGIRSFEPISRSHEGFVDILQVGIKEEEGYFYYIMELGDDEEHQQVIAPDRYVPKTLARELSRRGQLTFRECLRLGLGLSDALANLHHHGLVHRDIKPSNIIFVGGVPKLADIGLVSAVDEARSYVGTEGFIPPEGPGTPQADIFSLGKLLYEACTGKDRQEFPELPPGFDEVAGSKDFLELNEIILHACQNDPRKRYRSAAHMHSDLQLLTAGRSVRRLRLLERRFASLKRGATVALGAAVAATLLLFPVYVHWRDREASRQRQVGASLAYGTRAVESGDLAGSLPYFADALLLDRGDSAREALHRLRLGSALAQSPRLVQMWATTQQVDEVEFSLDGTKVLVVESFGGAGVFDVATGRAVSPRFGQSTWFWRGSLSPDGERAVLAGEDHTARIWRLHDGAELLRLPHPDKVFSAEFAPDGRRIVTGCRDKLGRVWDAQTGKLEFLLAGHEDALLFAGFSPDGRKIVSTAKDTTARMWDAIDGHKLGEPLWHTSWVYYAAFGPHEELVTAAFDRQARLWDLQTGQEILPRLPHQDGVKSAEFSPDGRLILTACLDGTARVWDRKSHLPWSRAPVLRHTGRLTHARFSPDGTRVVTSAVDGSVRVWDLSFVAPISRALGAHDLSSDKTVYVVRLGDTLRVHDTGSGRAISPVLPDRGQFQLSVDGRFVLTWPGPRSSSIQAETPAELCNIQSGEAIAARLPLSNEVRILEASQDGKRVMVGTTNQVLVGELRNAQKRTSTMLPLWEKYFDRTPLDGSRLSPDGTAVAAWTETNLYCCDAGTGRQLFLARSDCPIHFVCFSPNSRWLVSCESDGGFSPGRARVLDVLSGRLIRGPLNHGDGVVRAAFSPDGSRLVTASEDFTARIWDLTTGLPLGPPMRHQGQVRTATFSSDGKAIVTAGTDGFMRVWSADTADPLTPAFWHRRPLTDARFLPATNIIVTVDADRAGRVFELMSASHPLHEVVLISRLLTGDTIPVSTESGEPKTSLLAAWRQLHSRSPSDFTVSPDHTTAWHESQAEESEQEQDWPAVAYHLERLCALHPLDVSFKNRLDQARRNLAKGGR